MINKNSEEALAMIDAAKVNEKKFMIAHNQCFVTSHQEANEIIESGNLGKIYSFKTTFGHSGPEGRSVDGAGSCSLIKKKPLSGQWVTLEFIKRIEYVIYLEKFLK
ncbi:hypothetical protein ACFCYN_23965 [Gottfriedia sp. NPDC056225]|uniref:hypothetical protein n=1 Tax=Gottfriedia sp. NPDC056225 TaxID=3345751 RepID=UPI0035DCFF66